MTDGIYFAKNSRSICTDEPKITIHIYIYIYMWVCECMCSLQTYKYKADLLMDKNISAYVVSTKARYHLRLVSSLFCSDDIAVPIQIHYGVSKQYIHMLIIRNLYISLLAYNTPITHCRQNWIGLRNNVTNLNSLFTIITNKQTKRYFISYRLLQQQYLIRHLL